MQSFPIWVIKVAVMIRGQYAISSKLMVCKHSIYSFQIQFCWYRRLNLRVLLFNHIGLVGAKGASVIAVLVVMWEGNIFLSDSVLLPCGCILSHLAGTTLINVDPTAFGIRTKTDTIMCYGNPSNVLVPNKMSICYSGEYGKCFYPQMASINYMRFDMCLTCVWNLSFMFTKWLHIAVQCDICNPQF